MSKWLHEGLKEEKGLLKHLKVLGDKKTPFAPKGDDVCYATQKEARVVHLKEKLP